VLYAFTGVADGALPYAGVTRDVAGNLYGTTGYGGAIRCENGLGCGVAFRLDPAGTQTVLHTFTAGSDGANPTGRLIRDSQGNLYGTAFAGGSGYGTVFKLTRAGELTALHTFNGSDGSQPTGGLLFRNGTLYGTASAGGTYGAGVVFEIQP
jgi:uncharacterized repeat protein (TIGR03803 family)